MIDLPRTDGPGDALSQPTRPTRARRRRSRPGSRAIGLPRRAAGLLPAIARSSAGAAVWVTLGALAIGGCGSLSSKAQPGTGKAAVERPAGKKAGKLEIDANPEGKLAYTTNKAQAAPGPVTITMANMSGVMHNIAIEPGENGATQKGSPIAASGFVTDGSSSLTVNLKPGKYTFFCQAPGHRAAGMYGTLTVK